VNSGWCQIENKTKIDSPVLGSEASLQQEEQGTFGAPLAKANDFHKLFKTGRLINGEICTKPRNPLESTPPKANAKA
jgi:hypothetical protein